MQKRIALLFCIVVVVKSLGPIEGLLGQKYDIKLEPYEIYNLITSANLNINARFVPVFMNALQQTPSGMTIGEIGVQVANYEFQLLSNSSIILVDSIQVGSDNDWTQDLGNGLTVSNKNFGGNNYAFTVVTPDIVFSVIRKSIDVVGLPSQHRFDYKFQIATKNPKLHGLIGQTWETKFYKDKSGAFQYLDGELSDYLIGSAYIFGTDFKYNKFQYVAY